LDSTIIKNQIHKYARLLFLALILPLITLFYIPQIGIIMFVPFLYLALKQKNYVESLIFGALFGLFYFGIGFIWAQDQHILITILGYLSFALVYALMALIIFYGKGNSIRGILLMSFYWLILLIGMSLTSIGGWAFYYGIFAPLGPSLIVKQIGLIGLSVVTISFMTALTYYIRRKDKILLLISIILLMLLILPYSIVNTHDAHDIKVSVIQINDNNDWITRNQNAGNNINEFLRMSSIAVDEGTRIIVWPEYSVNIDIMNNVYMNHRVRIEEFAIENNVYLIIGSLIHDYDIGKHENTALLFTPKGMSPNYVGSLNPILFAEHALPSKELSYFNIDIDGVKYNVGVLLCFEEYSIRKKSEYENLDLLIIMSDSSRLYWGNNAADRFARFRAIEFEAYTLRSVNSGTSQIVAPNGKIIAKGKRQENSTITAQI